METTDLVYKSIQLLPEQIVHALHDTEGLDFPNDYKTPSNIVIGGMGGSIFSYHVIMSLYPDRLTVPFIVTNDYRLPQFVSDNTVFVGSSYSGSTEEVLETTKKAFDKGAMLTGITEGGELRDYLQSKSVPFYHITPTHNPSGQPRIAVGYMIVGTMSLLMKLGVLTLPASEITEAVAALKKNNEELSQQAHTFAEQLEDTGLIYVAAEHLSGATHVVRNQTNESAKTFAEYNLIPELNHHLMEGLNFPKDKNITFVFYTSSLYSQRVQKRMMLTKEVIEKQGVTVKVVDIQANNQTEQFMQYLQFGSYLTYFLAKKRGVNAAEVPWVDYFKEKLV